MINGSLSANSIYDEKTNRFFLFVQLKSSVLPPSRFIPLLFTWHEGSFFGSFFQESTFQGKTGIFLSPADALELFANNTENSFLQLEWCDQSELYRLLAPTVSSIFNQKAFQPDFSEWQNGRLSFSLTEEGNKLIQENPLLPSYKEKIEEWIGSIMKDWIKNEKTETLRSYWAEYSNSVSLPSHDSHTNYLDEEDWLKDIGWMKDTTPFFVGLRLLEPEEAYSDWKLETLLKDKKTEQLYVWEQDKLPTSYKKFKNEVERSFKKWQQITPSLFSNGQIREALTEEDAWRFLVDGSERLLDIGSFILLPSWWQAVKDSRLKIKARVNSSKKGSSHSTSFVGLQSLVNFEWRFSTRNTELSEEEFLALVEQNRRLVQIKGEWVVLDPQFIEEIKYHVRII